MRTLVTVSLVAVFCVTLLVGGTVLLGQLRTTEEVPADLVGSGVEPAAAGDARPDGTGGSSPSPTPPPSLPASVDYVALGDSFAAGLGLAPRSSAQPACGRSTENAASLLAAGLGVASFVDVSCTGAQTSDFTIMQNTVDPRRPEPQRDALSRDTDLVTVTLGGNDFDIFGTIVGTCVRVQSLDPDGAPCRESYAGAGAGEDPLASAPAVAARLTQVLSGIVDAAPRARVVVVGYPGFITDRTCDALGLAAGDAVFAASVFDELDAALARAAQIAGAEFVDTRPLSEGHDICSSVPWFAGYQPTPSAPAAWHPGADYHRALARLLIDDLSRWRDGHAGGSGAGPS